jgi:pyruvate dehydrogenase E1 component
MRIVPEQIARFVTGRTFLPLGTDGVGRSATREALRRFFEVDAAHIVVAVLTTLIGSHGINATTVEEAIAMFGIDTTAHHPLELD